jgi:hypothetical protein
MMDDEHHFGDLRIRGARQDGTWTIILVNTRRQEGFGSGPNIDLAMHKALEDLKRQK